MRVACPKCKRIVVLSDKYTGNRDICPHCFTPVEIDPAKKFVPSVLKWKTAFAQKGDQKDEKPDKGGKMKDEG